MQHPVSAVLLARVCGDIETVVICAFLQSPLGSECSLEQLLNVARAVCG